MLKLEGITKSYKQDLILDGISFTLEKGKVLGVMGPNGAGKTTLLKIISLILSPDAGEVHINGIDALRKPKLLRPLLAYVPQDMALFEELSVIDNLYYWSEGSFKSQEAHFMQLLDETGLSQVREKRVNTLSGGMKRRLNLAVALINKPELLIMDEPLVGMDIAQIKSMHQFFSKLAEQGMSQIISSHNAHHLLNIADELLILNHGKVRFQGTKESFLNLCNNDFAKVDQTILDVIDITEVTL